MAEVNVTGAEYKRFYSDPIIWGADDGTTYIEEDEVTVDSVPIDPATFNPRELADASIVKVTGGYLVNPPPGVPEDYVKAIKFWLRKQSTRQVLFEIAAEKLPELIAAAKALGAKEVEA